MASPAGSDAESLEDFSPVDSDSDDSHESRRPQQSYTILSEADICQRQEDDITSISSLLSISSVEAIILLLQYDWSVSKVHDEWFTDEEKVRKAVGMPVCPVVDMSNARELKCGICLGTFARDGVYSAACGHPFCGSCWAGYIKAAVNDGTSSLALRCADPSCPAAVGKDMIDSLASEDDREKYAHYFLRSYINDYRKTKWCPAPDCDYAVEFVAGSGSYDVTCYCSYAFCWNCTEEAHRPVDCNTAAKWILENGAESENIDWFDFDTRIESLHAREKYTFYYKRWNANHLSMQRAIEDLQYTQSVQLEKLSEVQREPESQLKFVTEAWSQIVEAKRVLKWIDVYGYYLPEYEEAKWQFFDHMQREAEANLDRLHRRTVHLKVYLDVDGPSEDFNEFRSSLATLTRVTRNYFEKLVRSLENGLPDVDSHGDLGRATSSNTVRVDGHGRGNRSVGVRRTLPLPPIFSYTPMWFCEWCTYGNLESVSACQMCDLRR